MIVAAIAAIGITEYKGDAWEQRVRSVLYRIAGDSIPEYSVELTDDNGIPYVDYKPLSGVHPGKRYNPTIVCNYAITYYQQFVANNDAQQKKRFFQCVKWLATHVTVNGGHALYVFNWQQPWYDSVRTPYTSGMTSGLAIKVFTLAHRLTGNVQYLDHARMLLRGFFIPVSAGGFTYQDRDGWWFEELADTAMHTPRILDGHIFAITGLMEYARLTKDDSATFVVNKGIAALKSRLPAYDAGDGGVYYDAYQLKADLKYHRILAAQMKELYVLTGDDMFLHYHKKWNKPLQQWYLVRIIRDMNMSGIILFSLVWAGIAALLFALSKLLRSTTRA